MSRTDLQSRLIDALAPNAANRERVAKYVARIAADLEDDRLFSGIVVAAEDKLIGTTEFVESVPGLTMRQLRYWTSTGLLQPVEECPGSGRTLRFHASQVAIAQQMMPFVLEGVAPTTARFLAGGIVEHGTAEFAGFTITASA